MKRQWLLLPLILTLAFIIPGCAPTPTICTAAEVRQPILISPEFYSTVDTSTPTLTWNYPIGAYDYSYPISYDYEDIAGCIPERFRITLRTGPYYTDDLGGFTVNGSTTSWTVPAPLQPGRKYSWGVQGVTGDVLGPYSGNYYFFVGPTCTAAELVAPTLLEPANDSVLTDNWPMLIWDHPSDCLPGTYNIWFSINEDFSEPSIMGYIGYPSMSWDPPYPLEDCETYYWKVAPVISATFGPESPTYHFKINMTGACPLEIPDIVEDFEWPLFHLNQNAACRIGPTLDYSILEYVLNGEEYRAEGQNEDGSWLLLRLDVDKTCWVSMNVGQLFGEVMELPHVIPPPIQFGIDCTIYSTVETCEANTACMWIQGPYNQGGFCINR